MQGWLLDLLACPSCGAAPLGHDRADALACPGCGAVFPVIRGVPRFVGEGEDYARNFGDQWRRFRTIQVDRLAGHALSETRLRNDTRWTPEEMAGKLVLDAGAGAGRFADVLAQWGARVVAVDMSGAVDACAENMADPTDAAPGRGEVAVVQADLLSLPLRADAFDFLHCAGVIQHTADPPAVIRALPLHLKPGGRLFYNFYEIDPTTRFQAVKYLLRRSTPGWPMDDLVPFCRALVQVFFWPSWLMSRIPVVRFFNRFLPICSVHPPGLDWRRQYELTVLDTVDWYGPKYEIRQDHGQVAAQLEDAGLVEVRADPGRAWARRRVTADQAGSTPNL